MDLIESTKNIRIQFPRGYSKLFQHFCAEIPTSLGIDHRSERACRSATRLCPIRLECPFSDIFKNWFLVTTASVSANQPKLAFVASLARGTYCRGGSKTLERHRYVAISSPNRRTVLKPDGRAIILYYAPYRRARDSFSFLLFFFSRAGPRAFNTTFTFPPRQERRKVSDTSQRSRRVVRLDRRDLRGSERNSVIDNCFHRSFREVLRKCVYTSFLKDIFTYSRGHRVITEHCEIVPP